MTKKCIGCGATLQSNDKNKVGYIPEKTVNEDRYCMRCFRIMHYNENIKEELLTNEKDMLSLVNKKAKYVFFLIDYLNLNNETITMFKNIKVPKTLLISKSDVIPTSLKKEKIINWLQEVYDFDDDIIFISSTSKKNITKIINIAKENDIQEAYILGFTNAGKSSLINSLASKYEIKDQTITTSLNPNTTLDFIKFKISDSLILVDTPGFNSNYDFSKGDYSLLKKVNPKKVIRPITYQSKNNLSFIIEDKLIINFLTNDNSITFYMSNNLSIEKKHTLQSNKCSKYSYDIFENNEIVIKGLGFINVKKACKVEIFTDNEDLIEIRKSSF
ncbi:MAG: GTPase RsgA [Bacilli bacterium]